MIRKKSSVRNRDKSDDIKIITGAVYYKGEYLESIIKIVTDSLVENMDEHTPKKARKDDKV